MTITIDDAKAAAIAEWLGRKYDALEKAVRKAAVPGDERKVARLNAEYGGIREGLAAAGVRIKFDRHTKRPVGIEAM